MSLLFLVPVKDLRLPDNKDFIIHGKSSNQSFRLICISFLCPLGPTTVTQVLQRAHHDCQHTQWVVSQERNIELEEFTAFTAMGGQPALNGDITTSLKAVSEKALTSHSSTLAWKIPWTEEPGRL